MAGEQKDEKPQGFVIVVEDCGSKNWVRIYLSKIGGEKKIKTCGPEFLEIFKATQELFLECRRVVLITRAHPAEHEREALIRRLKKYYPDIEITRVVAA